MVTWRLNLTMRDGKDSGATVAALREVAEIGFEAARRLLEGATGA